MCRNIRTLYNFAPPAAEEEIHAAALQFVRKISGFTKPSQKNQIAFDLAIREVTSISQQLLEALETTTMPKNRDIEKEKARARSANRFGNQSTRE